MGGWTSAGRASALVAVGVLALVGAGSSTADNIGCGQTITADTTLRSNLLCPASGDVGLTVVGLTVVNGATLNLNGHRILGSGAGAGIGVAPGATVENGSVVRFGVGITAGGGGHGDPGVDATVRDVTVLDSEIGIELFNRGTVTDTTVMGNGTGIFLQGFGFTRVMDSRVLNSNGDGISAFRGEPATYSGNLIRGNGGIGLHLHESVSTVTNNVVSKNGLDGIQITDDPTFALRYVVAGNVANDNGGLGITALPVPTDGGGNAARGNGDPAQCLNVVCARNRGLARK